jgi:hypothetical protein
MSAVPEDHPLMKAWKVHQATVDFANSKRWAAVPGHLQGSLWALFMAGFNAGFSEGRRQGLEEALKAVENGNCFVAADIIRVLIGESKS